MARNVCRIAGLALLVFGLAGFALPTMLGLHLTTIHNMPTNVTSAVRTCRKLLQIIVLTNPVSLFTR